MSLNADRLLAEAQELLPRAVELRRRLHLHPEIGLDLPKTTAAVLESLDGLGLEIARSKTTSGFVATLRGDRPGPGILLRADMDALPMPEDSGLEFASREPGRMHACGHDAHTAMLVGAAHLLHRHRAQLNGAVHLLFQPGEEGYFGALLMAEEGLFSGEGGPAAAFAIHIDPRLPCGKVAGRVGPMMAAADVWTIDLKGRGGHASMPHDTIDPIPVACEIVQALQTLVTRRFDVFDPVVLSCTKIEAGTTNNVIPESASLLGTLRSTSERARERAHEGIKRVATQVAAAHEVEAVVQVVSGYPVTVNDGGFVHFTRQVTEEVLGANAFVEMEAPLMGAEDFSYILQRLPGALVFLGMRPPGMKSVAPCHSNRMILSEDGMSAGIALHAAMAARYLERTA
jgi:amidohydrolase